jgi:hypothetical protein
MATTAEVEKLAFRLPDTEHAVLAAHLLRFLPSCTTRTRGWLRRCAGTPNSTRTLTRASSWTSLMNGSAGGDAVAAQLAGTNRC